MPWLVNGEVLPELMIKDELERLRKESGHEAAAETVEQSMRLREAAERNAIRRFVLEQAALRDPRPVDQALIQGEVERLKATGGCRSAFDDSALRQRIEAHARMQRISDEFVAAAPKPEVTEVREFYRANRERFRSPDRLHAANIIVHVNETRTEEGARATSLEIRTSQNTTCIRRRMGISS